MLTQTRLAASRCDATSEDHQRGAAFRDYGSYIENLKRGETVVFADADRTRARLPRPTMVYGFARQSGGQVRIYSEPGRGTMVCLYLPRHLAEAEEADRQVELSEAPRAGRNETVLIVDDEPTVRMLVTEVLEDLGYTAIEAADGAAALRLLQSGVHIDLLVTDVGLPGGMNGRQVADVARVTRPDMKVLFITGFAENAALSHGHLPPGMQMLTKPFAMEVLARRIKGLITGQTGSGG